MNTRYEQLPTTAEALRPQSTTASAEGQALEAARAEFRAAWQAKLNRANQIRTWAQFVERVGTWFGRVGVLIVLFSSCIVFVGLMVGMDPVTVVWKVARALRYPWLACSQTHLAAHVTRRLLKRSAERLEAAEIRLP